MSKMRDCRLVLNQGEGDSPEHDDGLLVLPSKPALKKPSMFQVVLVNDDFTPMDFVIEVLQKFFYMREEKATQIMLTVHTEGRAVCGVYTQDIAETKVVQVNQYSDACEHPLLCEHETVD